MTGGSNIANADRCGLTSVPNESCCPSKYTARVRVKIHHQQSNRGGTVGVRVRAEHQHPKPRLSSSWKGRDGGRWTTRSPALYKAGGRTRREETRRTREAEPKTEMAREEQGTSTSPHLVNPINQRKKEKKKNAWERDRERERERKKKQRRYRDKNQKENKTKRERKGGEDWVLRKQDVKTKKRRRGAERESEECFIQHLHFAAPCILITPLL
jgi:hypothetical protein